MNCRTPTIIGYQFTCKPDTVNKNQRTNLAISLVLL